MTTTAQNGNGRLSSHAIDDRLPRHNPVHERAVIGGLLIAPGQMADVLKIVSADHFYSERHQEMFRVLEDLYRDGKSWDVHIFATELEHRQRFDVIGGDGYLEIITSSIPHAALTMEHAAHVKEAADIRDLQSAADELARDAVSKQFTAAQVLERFRQRFSEVQPLGISRANESIFARLSDEAMGMRLASSIKSKAIQWLMPDRIPAMAYTLIAGEGKQGKSQFTMAMGAMISTGGEWWDGSGQVDQGHVLYLSAEDDAERVIRPRLEALGANLDMITILEARYKRPSKDGEESLIDVEAELSSLEYWQDVFRRIENPRIIFIDPLPSYIGRGVNDRKNSEVRAVLGPFIRLAVGFGMTLIGVTHLGKSIDPTKPIANRVLDSIAYTNLARAVHFIAKDPENPDRKFFMPGPCNYSMSGVGALAFTLEDHQVVLDDGSTVDVAVPKFEPAAIDVEAQDVVSVVGKKKPGPQSKIRREMAEWLYLRLNDGLPTPAVHVYNDCAEAFSHIKPNPLGVKDEKGYWTKGRVLRKVAEIDVPMLPYPQNGKRVDMFQDPTQGNRSYWRLVDNSLENEGERDASF